MVDKAVLTILNENYSNGYAIFFKIATIHLIYYHDFETLIDFNRGTILCKGFNTVRERILKMTDMDEYSKFEFEVFKKEI